MHFLDLAAAVEKLRWAEKEWRELDRELAETPEERQQPSPAASADEDEDGEVERDEPLIEVGSRS